MCFRDNQTAGLFRPESKMPCGKTRIYRGGANLRSMPMEQSHVSALQLKHEGLERAIREEMNRPAPDHAQVQLLKKRKLRLKEELEHI